MIILGLTGSIGMGKSTVAAMFREQKIPVFDADAEVHRLQGPGGALVDLIEQAFPGTASKGGIDRAVLSRYVLGDKVALHKLERIVHPAVAVARRNFLRRHKAKPLVVLDIPLLYEKKMQHLVDEVAVVSAPAWMQRKRVLRRAGMSPSKLAHIRALQVPDPVKRAQADHVIDTGIHREQTRAEIRRLIACLRGRQRR